MFNPKYTITHKLLENIKHITTIINDLNRRQFPSVVLLDFEKEAREVSSYASTSIEGNPLPLMEVKKILKNRPKYARDTEKEVLNYNNALEYLNGLVKKNNVNISLDFILSIQKKVVEGLMHNSQAGKLRTDPVVVNDPRSGKVVYLPPDVKDVYGLMNDLTGFMNENKDLVDYLILAGIFHKQMVVIHPFLDGSGRTGRLITKVLLAKMGLNTFNLFSFENYYNKNVTSYFKIVGEYGNYYDLVNDVDFTAWLEYFSDGIIDELLRVQKLFDQRKASPNLGLKEHHIKLLKYIKEKGAFTDKDYSKLTSRAKATRVLDFRKLMDLGFIDRMGVGPAVYYVPKKD